MSKNEARPSRNPTQESLSEVRPARRSFDRSGPLSFRGCPPDKVFRVFNDVRNRISQALERGWQFVSADAVLDGEKTINVAGDRGSAKSIAVDFDPRTGKPVIGYLMMIHKDWYNEDQEHKQAEMDEQLRALPENQKNSVPGAYVPKSNF